MKPWLLLGVLVLFVPVLSSAKEATPTEAALSCYASTDYLAQGAAAMAKPDYDAALDDFACAIQLAPDDYHPYVRHAEAALMARRYALADADYDYIHTQLELTAPNLLATVVADYDAALTAAPNDVLLHLYHGYAVQWNDSRRGPAQALTDFQFVLARDPDNQPAAVFAAQMEFFTGATEQGENDFAAVIARDAQNPDAWYELADAYKASEQWTNVIESADRAIALGSETPDLYSLRALALTTSGDNAGGAAAYVQYFDLVGPTRIDAGTLVPGKTLIVSLDQHQTAVMTFDVADKPHVTLRTQSKTDPVIVLIGPDGAPIQGNDDGGNSADSRLTLDLAAGHYTLLMTTYYGFGSGDIRVSMSAT